MHKIVINIKVLTNATNRIYNFPRLWLFSFSFWFSLFKRLFQSWHK